MQSVNQPGETTMRHQSLKSLAFQDMEAKRMTWISLAGAYISNRTQELAQLASQAHNDFLAAEKAYHNIHLKTKYSKDTVDVLQS